MQQPQAQGQIDLLIKQAEEKVDATKKKLRLTSKVLIALGIIGGICSICHGWNARNRAQHIISGNGHHDAPPTREEHIAQGFEVVTRAELELYDLLKMSSYLMFAISILVAAIGKCAFVASPYPVILSLEMHCCVDQQEKIAAMCNATLDEWLLPAPESIWETMSPETLKYRILLKGKTLLTFSSSKRRTEDPTGTQDEGEGGGVEPDVEGSAEAWEAEIDEDEDSDEEGSRSMLMTHGNLSAANEDSWHVEEEEDDGSGRAKHHHLHELHLPYLRRNLHLPHLPHLPHLHRAGHRQPGGGETNQRSSTGDDASCQRCSPADDAGAPSAVEGGEGGMDSAGSASASTTRHSSRSHHAHLHLPNLHLPHLGHFSSHHEHAPPSESQAAGGDATVLPHLHAHHQAAHHRHAHTMHLLNHGPPKEARQSVKLSSSLSSLTYLSVVKTSSHLRPGMAPCQASALGELQTHRMTRLRKAGSCRTTLHPA